MTDAVVAEKKKYSHEDLRKTLRGNIVPLPGQFNDDLSLNLNGYKEHLSFLLENNVKIIYLALSASEFEYMSYDERMTVTELVVNEVKGRAIVLGQPVGEACANSFVRETKQMIELGVDAIVIKPYHLKEEQKFFSTVYRNKSYSSTKAKVNQSFIDLYKRVSDETGASIIYHDKPFRSFELIDELMKIDNMVGYKSHEANPWIRQELFSRYKDRVVCFDGLGKTDQMWSFSWGAKARHTCWSWYDPKRDQQFVEYITKGDYTAAVKLVNEEWKFVDAILSTGFHGYKMAMELVGLPGGPVRIPGANIDPQGKELVKKAMLEMGYTLKA